MVDTFQRLFRLLQLIPRAPKCIDTEALVAALAHEGIDVEVRTIQRDLVRLESMDFGLECLDDSKPYRWRSGPTARPLLVPSVDPQAALALRIVELHRQRMVPSSVWKAKEIELHPLGLVSRDAVAYVVARAWEYPDVRLYALHRFVNAVILEARAKPPPASTSTHSSNAAS